MLCPRCDGKHVVVKNGSRVPCPECAGVGELHCCDGLREQDDCPESAPNLPASATVERHTREAARPTS